ncbi:LLM class flavin-dependent oxidoreductase [Caballeronia sp. DA-9]|uniref:LLM class flavin-dependent oxidoreductase n=1 Tax=Caballeronia sp. DA-9 TaxID=3436237 RepID=UPI003F67926D
MSHTKQMSLGVFVQSAGHHIGGWRLPDAESGGENVELFKRIARIAEAGLFDLLFLGDSLATSEKSSPSLVSRFEPMTILSLLAGVTSRLGLVATASTTYGEPYTLARQFASLDHLSGGRAGWNVVTSSSASAALNYSQAERQTPDARYRRANEFVEVVKALWDSWEDDAIVRDKAKGKYLDPSRLHRVGHAGEHFQIQGPLNISRPPQGHPVIVQAGSSEPGIRLAARTGEVIFVAHATLASARSFVAALTKALEEAGRHRSDVRVMPGIMPIVADTQEEAKALAAKLEDNIDLPIALAVLSGELGHDISTYPLDAAIPDLPPTQGTVSRRALLLEMAAADSLTLRQLAYKAAASRGHFLFVGTPEMLADLLQSWFEAGVADGFNIMPPYFPGGLQTFVDHVVPILQQRDLFRTEYAGTKLRQHLGFAKPENPHTAIRERQLSPS